MNDFFSSIVTSLNLPDSQNADPLSEDIDHPTLKAFLKWKNHASALAITVFHKNQQRFTFSRFTLADAAKENNILNSSKVLQEANLSVKILKDNKEFFEAYITKYFKDSFKCAKVSTLLAVGISYSSYQERCTCI